MPAAVARLNPLSVSVVREAPGRLRARLPILERRDPAPLIRNVRGVAGVRRVEANAATGRVLIAFDPAIVERDRLLALLETSAATLPDAPPARPRSLRVFNLEREGRRRWVRIPCPGLDNPHIAARVEARLRRLSVGVVRASALTGRVLVQFTEGALELEGLMAELEDLGVVSSDRRRIPLDPLDRGPLLQAGTRALGGLAGLGFLATRQLLGLTAPPAGATVAARMADVISIVRGFSGVRASMRTLLTPDVADTLFSAAGIFTLTLARGTLGLTVLLVEGLRLLTAVRARQHAWRRFERELSPTPRPGETLQVMPRERLPLQAVVRAGTGTAVSPNAALIPIRPGLALGAGSFLLGGACVAELQAPAGAYRDAVSTNGGQGGLYGQYVRLIAPASMVCAAVTGLMRRSLWRAFAALVLINARTAIIGTEAADQGAGAYAARMGLLVNGPRGRPLRRPDAVVLATPRLLVDRVSVVATTHLADSVTAEKALGLAGSVSAAAHDPWGPVWPPNRLKARRGAFEGDRARAEVDGAEYVLSRLSDDVIPSGNGSVYEAGDVLLQLSSESEALALFVLRAQPPVRFVDALKREAKRGVFFGVCASPSDTAAAALARRAGVHFVHAQGVDAVRRMQGRGMHVAVVTDSIDDRAMLAAADLSIGIADHRWGFDAPVDVIAPDLAAVAAIPGIGRRRDLAVRDATALAIAANGVGLAASLNSRLTFEKAHAGINLANIAAVVDGWLRLPVASLGTGLTLTPQDPRPERWALYTAGDVMAMLQSRHDGLSMSEAALRVQGPDRRQHLSPKTFASEILEQLQSPFVAIMGAGALASLLAGKAADVAIIAGTILTNAIMAALSERGVTDAAVLLDQMTRPQARVRRAGVITMTSAENVAPGDILVLTPGDQVTADARLIESENLQLDESALTGESLPADKSVEGASLESRMVFAGTDVVAGRGVAVAAGVGAGTRLGVAAAAGGSAHAESALDRRLAELLRLSLPFAAAAGALTFVAGLVRRQPVLTHLALGATVVIAAVPEGLPLLARVSEAAAARRLARHGAIVKGLGAVEALGRVDVVCADKTGTLTAGEFVVQVVSDLVTEIHRGASLPDSHCRVLRAAALASPEPASEAARAHPTDRAVLDAAIHAGFDTAAFNHRTIQLPFDPQRGYHATWVDGTVYVKGAPETLTPRCRAARIGGKTLMLDGAGQERLSELIGRMAKRGMRVLLVAEGEQTPPGEEPDGLTVMGLLGIGDAARQTAADAIARCHEAGVRVMMVTGDHPETARAISRTLGLDPGIRGLITGPEMAELELDDLGARLEEIRVIARATPLDKLRVVQALQRRGHAVAMTGDGANDGPALRAADVGIAMGQGTEVARQAAQLILREDDFTVLLDALVEGRSYWRNVRRSAALLLGGNLGELLSLAGPVVTTGTTPLTTRQMLGVNLITDVLPALVIATQPPQHGRLHQLAREGQRAVERTLRREILRRAVSVSIPTVGAYVFARGRSPLPVASGVAFVNLVTSQLAHTLDSAWLEGTVNWPVIGAVVGSAGLVVAAMAIRPIGALFELTRPGVASVGLVTAATAASVLLNRLLRRRNHNHRGSPTLGQSH